MRFFASALAFAAMISGTVLLGVPEIACAGMYRLDEGSTHAYGCIPPPCYCAFYFEALSGTFRLTPAGREGRLLVFDVSDVRWESTCTAPTCSPMAVRGSGRYEVDRVAREQRLVLDLQTDERRVQDGWGHYDSGIVPILEDLPVISADILMRRGYCVSSGLHLRARPAWTVPLALTEEPALPSQLPAAPAGPRLGIDSGPQAAVAAPPTVTTWAAVKALYRARGND